MTPDASWLHRLAPGCKLAGLAVASTLLLLESDARLLGAALAVLIVLYATARIPPRLAVAPLRSAAPLLLVVGLIQGLGVGWAEGLLVVLRLATLVLLASLVTLTTTAAAMTAALEAGLRPLARLGWRPRAIALTLSLPLRFLPLLADRAAQVREAQRARGVERSFVALAVPLIVQGLIMAHEIAEAIEARGFDPDEP